MVKMEGQIKHADKIRTELTKFTNANLEENISFVTVESGDSGGSSIVEVEFRGNGEPDKK